MIVCRLGSAPDWKSPAEKSGISIAKVRIAATIWFLDSVEAKTPIAMKYAPMSAMPR